MSGTLKLYHAPASPNSRRVQMFIAEKRIDVNLVAVDVEWLHQHLKRRHENIGQQCRDGWR